MKVTNFLHLSRTKNLLRGIMFAPLLLLAACNESPATAGSGTDLDPETGLESDIVITLLGDNAITLTEGSTFSDPGAQAFDENNDELTINVSGEVNSLKPGVYVLTYSATDELGNEVSEERTVTVLDGTAPVISLNGNTTVTLFQGQAFIEEGASALDNVDGDISANINISGEVDTNTAATYTLTYSVSDAAGNKASIERTVVVTNSYPPVVTLTGPAEITLDQDTDYVDAGATATDVEDGVLPVTVTGSVDTGKPGLYTLVFSATDADNNSSQVERTIIVLDTQAPSLSLNGPAELSINQNSVYDELGATATDNADGEITLSISGSVDTLKPASYTLTYTATDAAGNSSQTQRVVNVLDITAPVISLNGDAVIELNEGEQFIDPGATATDAEDGTVAITLEGEVDSSTPATYYLTYRAEDKDGNAVTAVRTIKVLDITAPVITLTGQNTLNINQGEQFIEPGVSAVDNKDGDINVTTTGQVNADAVGSYTLTYSATDAAGNSASTTRTVEVLDVTAPVVQLNGEAFVTLNHPANYAEQGANATDAVDGEIDVVITGQLNAETIGTYTLTYSATDAAGNSASKTRTVTVVDVTAPIISLNGNEFLNLNQDVVYSELGASATDAADGDIDIVISGEVQTQTVGTYTLTYSATDASGNTASKTRRVNILDPNAPVISLNGSDTLNINQGSVYVEQGASAIDAVDGDIEVVITGQVNADVVGSYTLVYSATDSAGNRASIPRTVHVLDVTAPVISLIGEASITLNHPANYVEQGASASDAVNGDIDVVITGQVNAQTIGTYTLTYSATDAAGNSATATRTVNVIDVTPPAVSLIGSAVMTTSHGQAFLDPGAQALDAVDGTLTISTSGTVNTQAVGTYTLTYSATDAAGNQASVERNVRVEDHTPPVISLSGSNPLTLKLGSEYLEPGSSAVDAVDGTVTVSASGTVNIQKVGSYSLTYSTVDAAGNQSQVSRVVEVMQRPFITTWQTDNGGVAAEHFIELPVEKVSVFRRVPDFNFTVDWGDGQTTDYSTEANINETTLKHVYDNAGSYQVSITGAFPSLNFSCANEENNKMLSVDQWGDIEWYSMEYGFQECNQRTITATDAPVFTPNASTFSMFHYATNFNDNIGHWDMTNVKSMSSMFTGASTFNQDIGQWNVSRADRLDGMFTRASSFNQNLNSWNVSGVYNFAAMFYEATEFNSPIGDWNVSSATNMDAMFYYAGKFDQDISQWDVSNVESFARMFNYAKAFNQDISLWKTSKVEDMYRTFYGAHSFNQNIANWDVSNVEDMRSTFSDATVFNQDISDWDVSKVKNMTGLFSGAKAFNQDIGGWDVSNVIQMTHMFSTSEQFNQDISSWNVSNVTNMNYMFSGATAFSQDLRDWNVANVTSMRGMFKDAAAFNNGYGVSLWDVSKVTNMVEMFSGVKLYFTGYDSILKNWSQLNLQRDVFFDAGNSQHSQNATVYKAILTENLGWSINDNDEIWIGPRP